MNLFIFLFVTFACIVTGELQNNSLTVSNSGKYSNVYKFVNRDSRAIRVSNKNNSIDVKVSKSIYKNGNQKVGVFGGVNGFKNGKYDNVQAGVNIGSRNGSNLNILAQHGKTGNKIGAKGNLNILKTNNHAIRTSGFVTKDLSKTGRGGSKYNGTLEYIKNNKFKAGLSAQYDSKLGNKIAADVKYDILKSDKNKLRATGSWDRETRKNSTSRHSFGGGLDFSRSNSFDGSIGVKHSGALNRTDLALTGHIKSLGGLKFKAEASKTAQGAFKPSFSFSFGSNSEIQHA